MKTNCSIEELASLLEGGKSVLLFPHIQIDGDSLGSSVALCRALRASGKRADILIEEELPSNIAFLDEGFCIKAGELKNDAEICMAVDCSDIDRLGIRRETFSRGRQTVSIDHHITHKPFAQYNYIDEEAAASGEIVYRLLLAMNIRIDGPAAEALYAAIATDTGNYQYSNTTAESHRITAALYDAGMDHNKVAVSIYQNQKPEKMKITAKVLGTLSFFREGKGCIAYVSQEMLQETGAPMSETDGIVEQMRNISGVEIAILLKEEPDLIKAGMRSKTDADVSLIAQAFGGGGHRKAAGFNFQGSLMDAREAVVKAAEAHLAALSG